MNTSDAESDDLDRRLAYLQMTAADRERLAAIAPTLKAGSQEFPLQISHTDDGSDVNKGLPWVYANELKALDDAMEFARNAPVVWAAEAASRLEDAIENFTASIKADGSDPYYRFDPGPGRLPITVTAPTNVWTARTPLDARVPANFAGGSTGDPGHDGSAGDNPGPNTAPPGPSPDPDGRP